MLYDVWQTHAITQPMARFIKNAQHTAHKQQGSQKKNNAGVVMQFADGFKVFVPNNYHDHRQYDRGMFEHNPLQGVTV